MWFIGLDVHMRRSSICILDNHGKRVKEKQVLGPWSEVLKELKTVQRPFAICYEASCSYGYLYDQLRQLTPQVVVAHPGRLRLIFNSKQKNDRVDARKLATLLFLDQVPVVHVPSVEVRSWRSMINYRQGLVAKQTQAKNTLRALLRGHGVESPRRTRLWTQAGKRWLAGLEWPTSQATLQRDLLLDELTHVEAQVKRVTQELNRMGQRHPGVCLLQTIPGVGPRTAEAAVAYLDDPERFTRNKRVGSYFGLVPCQDSSAEANRLGHITREGPSVVRRLLTEAAWQGIRRSPRIRAFFERIHGGNPKRKNIALVATAHYLIRVMHAMLRTGEGWREERPAA